MAIVGIDNPASATAADIAALPADAFAGATADDFAAMPPDAMGGMGPDMMAAMPPMQWGYGCRYDGSDATRCNGRYGCPI